MLPLVIAMPANTAGTLPFLRTISHVTALFNVTVKGVQPAISDATEEADGLSAGFSRVPALLRHWAFIASVAQHGRFA